MCGKFEVFTLDELSQIISAVECASPLQPIADWPARFPVVHPGDEISAIVPTLESAHDTAPGTAHGSEPNATPGAKLGVRKLVWGYEAPWDQRRGLAFNSRIERAHEQSMWTRGFTENRVLIATPAFYETDAKHKPQRFIAVGSDNVTLPGNIPPNSVSNDPNAITPLLMAGIAEDDRFSLVTCPADETVSKHHDRMPLILDSASALEWLEIGPDKIQRASRIKLRHVPTAPLPNQLSLF